MTNLNRPGSATAAPSRPEIRALARDLAARFRERAPAHDQQGSFPYENFSDLRAVGYPRLTIPARLGGWGAGMFEAVQAQEQLAIGDGSTALAIAMHVQTIGAAASGEKWDKALFEEVCEAVVDRGALINSCASEPELGSPSRGGLPATTAIREGDDWRITGHKTFASMSPVLDFFIIPAAFTDDQGETRSARFLVPRGPNLEIVETWDSVGMRSTGSHDIYLNDVRIPARNVISIAEGGVRPDPARIALNPWFTLMISAVYLGVAQAALAVAVDFAHTRQPTALGKPIATLESIQRRIGEAEFTLQGARATLYHTAQRYDRGVAASSLDNPPTGGAQPPAEVDFNEALLVAKLTATNGAIKVVDDAMRVVGGTSMTHQTPLERYYRDVRAGLFHPPFDDSALPLLGRAVLNRES